MMKKGKCAVSEDVMGVYRKLDSGVCSGRDDLRWNEEALKNFKSLYCLENEKYVLPLIDEYFTKVLTDNLRNKNVIMF